MKNDHKLYLCKWYFRGELYFVPEIVTLKMNYNLYKYCPIQVFNLIILMHILE